LGTVGYPTATNVLADKMAGCSFSPVGRRKGSGTDIELAADCDNEVIDDTNI